MAERNESPNLDDYRTMMTGMHAPTHLRTDVLHEAACVRNSSRKPVHVHGRRFAPRFGYAAAACVALATVLAVAGGAAAGTHDTPWAPIAHLVSGEAQENSFALAAYAAEGDASAPGGPVRLDSSDFRGGGGYSGPWYNPADETFWDFTWAGYKYALNLTCTGSNIEQVTYSIEGERSYFELLDLDMSSQPADERAGDGRAFHYVTSFTVDYDKQYDEDAGIVRSLYVGFPLSDEGLDAFDHLREEGYSDQYNKQLDFAIERGAAREVSQSKLSVTATFKDGSTQTKTYTIQPVDDFDQLYSRFWDERIAAQRQMKEADEQGRDPGSIPYPDMPKLYTITEIAEP